METEETKDLIKQFTDTAKSKNIPLYYDNEYGVDADIFNWLPNAIVTETPPPTGVWKQVDTKNDTNEKTMQETSVKMSLSQAIVKFTEMLKNGDFDKSETHRIIFLTETRNGNPLRLVCRRYSGGGLDLYVYDVGPGSVWYAAGGAWFSSNEPLETSFDTFNLCNLDLEKAIEL